jgi:hypothetical protein
MNNPWHPTLDEIREWAHDPTALDPCEDWDLALCWAKHQRAYLELASDATCPKRRYFLGVLYMMVGDAVRTNFQSLPRPIVEGIVACGDQHDDLHVKQWQSRCRQLLGHPELFDYERWWGWGFANET